MNDFPTIIKEWETFYLLTGTAAATLIGLLFVAVSLHIDTFQQRTSMEMHHFAALTFNCFFYVLLISILFLVPNLTPLGLGLPLLLLSGLALGNALIQQRRTRKAHTARQEVIAAKFNVPILSLVVMVVASILILLQIPFGLYGLIVVVLLFLISASLNAWSLLIQAIE